MVAARTPTRDARRAPLLPPWYDRALPRTWRGGALDRRALLLNPGFSTRWAVPPRVSPAKATEPPRTRERTSDDAEHPDGPPRRQGEKETACRPHPKRSGLALKRSSRSRRRSAALDKVLATAADAASHREAPLISLDPSADITDFFFFRSYEPRDGEPGRPDHGRDERGAQLRAELLELRPERHLLVRPRHQRGRHREDMRSSSTSRNEFRGVSNDWACSTVALPPITALDGNGSQGLGFRQRYSVTMVKGGQRTVLADGLIAAPSNVGPRTMPDYDALAAQALYSSANSALHRRQGVRRAAGRSVLHRPRRPCSTRSTCAARAPTCSPGFNVHEINRPAVLMVAGGQNVLDFYASTSRQLVSVRGEAKGTPVQVRRLLNNNSSTRRSSARRTRTSGTRPSRRTRRRSSTTTATCASARRCRLSSARRRRRCSTCPVCC